MTTTKKTAKKAPAKKAAPVPAPKIEGRPAVVEELRRLGWDGPTSYTLTVLRDELLPWVAAGKPEGNDAIPAGATNYAHPKPRTAKPVQPVVPASDQGRARCPR